MDELDLLIQARQTGKLERAPTDSDSFIALVEETLDLVYDVSMKDILVEEEDSTTKRTAKEFLLVLPKFSPSEAWGDPNSTDRATINKIFGVVGGGATIEEKLKFIQRIADPSNKITSPRRIISTLIILESLSAVITSFSSAPAGFVFEGFLSALLRGRQEAEVSEKGNLPIQDLIAFSELGGGFPVSLKLLSKKTAIEGSYTNLVDALDEYERMIYVVARKDGNHIALEEFTFTRDNFIDALVSKASGSTMKKTANLFTLDGKTPKASVAYLNSLADWSEKYAALQHTLGYTGKPQEAEEAEVITLAEPETELDIAAEGLLVESKTQWDISPKQLPTLSGVDYKVLGTLPYSSKEIEKIAQLHMDKLGDSLFELFEATKSLSENVNKYFTDKLRSNAIKSGEKAIENTTQIQNSLEKEVRAPDDKKSA